MEAVSCWHTCRKAGWGVGKCGEPKAREITRVCSVIGQNVLIVSGQEQQRWNRRSCSKSELSGSIVPYVLTGNTYVHFCPSASKCLLLPFIIPRPPDAAFPSQPAQNESTSCCAPLSHRTLMPPCVSLSLSTYSVCLWFEPVLLANRSQFKGS